MIRLVFASEEIEELRHQRFYHPHPYVQRKMETLLLRSCDLPHHHIAQIVGICPNTLRDYLKEYQEGGVERLQQISFYKPESALTPFEGTLKAYFQQHPPATIPEAAAEIERLTGIKRGPTQVRRFLQSMGMKRRKTASLPGKADVAQQEAFREHELKPRLEEARQGKRTVFFVDAAHFVFAPFLGFLWCFTRLFVKAPSGRKRFNVLGALNAVTHQLITVTNETYINAQSVCSLLSQIAQQNLALPITLVLDNARYQHCALVQQCAAFLGIELLFLPPYSPNLNLIERLWKFVKKHCLYSKYYPDFAAFQGAISGFLQTVHLRHSRELGTLLSHRFQDFSQAEIHLAAA